MKIVFIGDIVGRPGRSFVNQCAKELREELHADLIIANAENSAGGAGVTGSIATALHNSGIDGITLGDHTWDQRAFVDEIDTLDFICRPANMSDRCPGKDHLILETNGQRVGVFTVLGQTFMKKKASCPFDCADAMLERLQGKVDAIVIEIHAEATSEKIAFGRYFDGRASMVVGTHTHVGTADGTIFPGGTAYITDLGMTGPHDSVIGTKKEIIIAQYKDGMPRRYEVASDDVRINACVVTIEEGRAVDFETLCVFQEDEDKD